MEDKCEDAVFELWDVIVSLALKWPVRQQNVRTSYKNLRMPDIASEMKRYQIYAHWKDDDEIILQRTVKTFRYLLDWVNADFNDQLSCNSEGIENKVKKIQTKMWKGQNDKVFLRAVQRRNRLAQRMQREIEISLRKQPLFFITDIEKILREAIRKHIDNLSSNNKIIKRIIVLFYQVNYL